MTKDEMPSINVLKVATWINSARKT